MFDPFFLKLLISFIVGSMWAIIATIAADNFGSKIGGLIAGLPSTLLFGLLFIAWTQSSYASVEATTIVPAIGGINSLFLVSYVLFIKEGIWSSLIKSTFLWAVLSFFLVFIHLNNYAVSLFIYTVLLLLSYYLLECTLKVKSISGKKVRYTPGVILCRGVISGFIVALSVYIAQIGGPVLGGMFAMFPAMFTSTLVITYFAHGSEFSAGIAKSSLLSAISVVVYSILVRYTYLSIGVIWGSIISIASSYMVGYLLFHYLIKRTK